MSRNQDVDPEMYQAFVSFWTHQDRLMWSRVTWAIAIEAAIIVGSFAKPGMLGFFLIMFGTIILCLLWGLFKKDGRDQQNALSIIDLFHEQKGFPFPKARVLSEARCMWESGAWLIKVIAILALVINIFLGLAHLIFWLDIDLIKKVITTMFT